jgi:hypothetical protein
MGPNRVTPTKFGFGKQFPKPFSLPTAPQILRADGLFSVSPLWHLGGFRFFLFVCDLRFLLSNQFFE